MEKEDLEGILQMTRREEVVDRYEIDSQDGTFVTETGVEYPVEDGKVAVTEHYRWLEDTEGEEVDRWTDEQNKLTRKALENVPGRDYVEARLKELLDVETNTLSALRKGKLFFYKKRPGQNVPALYVRKVDEEKAELLFDPNEIDKEGLVAVRESFTSPDGSKVALAISEKGSKQLTTKILDVATKKIEEEIPNTQWLSLRWLEDSSGFYYTRYPEKGEVPEGEEEWTREAFFHKLGEDYKSDKLITKMGAVEGPIFDIMGITPDGKKLLVVMEELSKSTDVYLVDVETSEVETVAEGFDALIYPKIKDDFIYFHTNKDAPNWQVFRAPVNNPSVENWETVIPESDKVLDVLRLTKSTLIAKYSENAQHRLIRHSLDGKVLGELDLSSMAEVLGTVTSKKHSDDVFVRYTTFLDPATIMRFEMSGERTKMFPSSIKPLSHDEYEARQVWYESKDGTKVSMFLVHRKDMKNEGKNPTILYGYGGFNISINPSLGSNFRAWVEKGGVIAMPNLRGGCEYGEKWHREGMLDKKQNVFDDFAAAAKYLIDEKITSAEHLGISGGSNGGLLTATSEVQHPELFGAVCIAVPVIDMMRYDKFPGSGHFWVAEYGTSSNPEQVGFLLKYSPLHNVVEGEHYPATLVMTGDHDDHVFVGQAYKMGAALQHANASENPILMRVTKNTGHGAGKPISKFIEEGVDFLSFFSKSLGLKFE